MDSFHLLSILPYPEKQYLVNEQCDQEYNQAQRIFIYLLLGAGIIKPYITDWVITVSRIFQAPLIWAKIKHHSTVILLGELMGFIVHCI